MKRRFFIKFIGAAVLGFSIPIKNLSPSIYSREDLLNELNITTVKVFSKILRDDIFKSQPLLEYLKKGKCIRITTDD